MKFTTLMSGSKGNCILVSGKNTHILVDMGCSTRYLKNALAAFKLSLDDISGIFITHEHSDHIKGMATLLKNYQVPVFTSTLTWNEMPFKSEVFKYKQNILSSGLEIGNLGIDVFKLSHDAVDPLGISISDGRYKLTVATDTGTPTPPLMEALKDSHGLIIEANYNDNLLALGHYPPFLKSRIRGRLGHLSNIQCAACLNAVINQKTRAVLLAHLSENNNSPQTALREVGENLKRELLPENMLLSVAPNRQAHAIVDLDQRGCIF